MESAEKERRTFIYTVGAMCMVGRGMFESSTVLNPPEEVNLLMQGIFLFAMGYLIVTQYMTKVSLVFFSYLGLMCLYTYANVHYYYIISTFLCIWAVRGVDLNFFLRWKLRVLTLYLSLHVVIYFILKYLMPEMISYAYRNGIQRDSFLITHPNTFAMFTAWAVFEYIYLHYARLRIRDYFGILLITAFVKKFTDTNTFLLCIVVVLFLTIMDKRGNQFFRKLLYLFSRYGFLVLTVFFSVLTASYTRLTGAALQFYDLLNRLFTGRLLYGACVYDFYGGTLLGQSVSFGEKTYWRGYWFDVISCDNTYVWAFVNFGLIYMLLIGAGFFMISKKTTTAQQILITSYTLYGIMEAYILNAMFCFPVLFIGLCLWDAAGEKESGIGRQKKRISVEEGTY
mgnify:FL=1